MEERNRPPSETTAMEPEAGGTCIVCCASKEQGIRIFQQFLCTDCEREIVKTDVQDDKYPYYIDRMKQIWQSAIS